MKRIYKKRNFPVNQIRKYMEVGPVVLVSSQWKGQQNIMTMGWHTVMEFTPSLIGCIIANTNHSYHMIEKSGECVLNIPTVNLMKEIIGIGNSTGSELNKFEAFHLTAQKAAKVEAPLIKECFANFECKVADKKMIKNYNFFILEVQKAHVAITPNYPKTVHYRGEGVFMVSGKNVSLPGKFKPQNL